MYRSLGESGELTARVVGALWWERGEGLEQIESLVARRDRGPAGRYSPTSVKLMIDGIIENQTASMTEPYFTPTARRPTTAGMDFIDPEVLREAVVRLDALGFQPHFHALGDRAVRQALDAVEAARARERVVGHAPPPRPHPGRPPGRRAAVPPARRARERAGAVGGRARSR